MIVDRALIGLSLCALLVGLIFPVGATVSNPFLGYGIVVFSWPAWAIGAIAGAFSGFGQRKDGTPRAGRRWGQVLCVANVCAAVATMLIPFRAG